jgi:hypothetical protein
MHAEPARPTARVIVSQRKSSPVALAIFALAYIGVLVIIFAPEGRFTAAPTDHHTLR